MLLPPAMRDQDRQPSNPFGARRPRPDELRGPQPPVAPVLKRTALPEPAPQHFSDHKMIVRDLPTSSLKPHLAAFLANTMVVLSARFRSGL